MLKRQHSNGRMSQIVQFPLTGTMVVLSGQVSDDPSGSLEEQTKNILAKIDGLLADAGTDKSAIIQVNIWLASAGDFDAMNAVYDAWVSPGNEPARICVEGRLAVPDLRLEIQAIAIKAT